MKDKSFNLIIVSIVGIVLLVGALLILQDVKSTGKAIAAPKLRQESPALTLEPKPESGELCEIKSDCKLLSSCSSVSDGLVSDGIDMGCVDAASTGNIPYCTHMTTARGGAACVPKDKNPRCVCL